MCTRSELELEKYLGDSVKKVCKPQIDDIATATKPQLDKTRETLAPYTKEAVQLMGSFLNRDQVP